MSRFLTEKYQTLAPYVPGEQPKDRQYIKLNTNESPFAPSKKAIEYVMAQAEKLMLYPDPDCKDLVRAVAKEYKVNPEQVILTNGSDEVLNFAFMAYCDKDKPAVFPDITYGFYKVFADINNVPYLEIPLKEDFTVDVQDYIKAKGTVFIANPNAPTGIALRVSEIEKILASDKNRMVVIDEAYVDFYGESCVSLIDKYENLLVTQTFSKSRSMAGARLGFGIANKDIISDLMRIKYSTNPYNVNRMTAAAGIGAIEDKFYFESNCAVIVKTREQIQKELKNLGFTVTTSNANFIFAKHDKVGGKELYLKLKERGILVRHFDKQRICDYVRITVGSNEEMRAFVKATKDILENDI
ncbi:MAG: histidinol-phosphate transaminase [Clostridia bacterium]|nr:histidinol-phosphate transaminase [Clostridia bacterium]